MVNGMLPRDEDAVVQEPGEIVSDNDDSVKVLRISSHDIDFNRILAAAVQMFGTADIISKIQKGSEFIVQVPARYQADLQTGVLEMMHGAKSGKTWATIVRKLADGRQEIVCNCPITERFGIQGSAIQSLSGICSALCMQQKLDYLTEKVQKVYDIVIRIEQGQRDNRMGTLLSGCADIRRALMNHDIGARKRELELARDKISTVQQQIAVNFKSRVEQFSPIPENKIIRWFRGIRSSTADYIERQDEEFGKLEEYFYTYLSATRLLGCSYSVVGEIERAEDVFEKGISFLGSVNLENVRTLDYIYPERSMDDAFYYQPVQYMQAEKNACLKDSQPYEYVQIIASSEELLEVIENGKGI